MKVVRGYKTKLDLNDAHRTACMKHAGAARFSYNWGLARSVEAYRTTGKRLTAIELHRELNALKQAEYPWMYEVSKCAPQEALRDLEKAYKNFFRRVELKKQGERQKFRRRLASRNRKKTCRALAKQHARIAHIRRDGAHKLTSYLCKNHALIAIEDLHVAGMLKNHHLAQAVSDSNFGEIRRQLEYKAVWHGVHLVTIDRFYPSSKTCSACGWIAEQLDLSVRTFVCQTCGLVIDRDPNAAMNLVNEALQTTGSFSESHACGQGSSGTVNGLCETPLDEAGTNQQHGLSISV